jgi:hypothetical protein
MSLWWTLNLPDPFGFDSLGMSMAPERIWWADLPGVRSAY